MDAISTGWEEVVLQWRRSKIRVHNVARLIMHLRYPFGKLHRIWNRRGKEDISDFVREKNDGLFPNNAPR
jgi:hypothetical protein